MIQRINLQKRLHTKPESYKKCSGFFVFALVLLMILGFAYFEYNENIAIVKSVGVIKVSENKLSVRSVQPQMLNTSSNTLIIGKLLGKKESPNSYVTLLHGIDNTYTYRGYLYNILIMKKALNTLGSKADFIVLIGFTSDGDLAEHHLFKEDLQILQNHGIRLYYLPRLQPSKRKVSFAEMALLKITPWSFIEYEKIQYLDGDILPTKNLDCFFQLTMNTFNTGNASPLNSGWYLCIPNNKYYLMMNELAVIRLNNPWDEELGWGKAVPEGVFFRGGRKEVKKWSFNGASLDQGLLFYTLCMNIGDAMLFDIKEAIKYNISPSIQRSTFSIKSILQLQSCHGLTSMDMFYHFTGQSKPWLKKNLINTKDKGLVLWRQQLDALHMPINSTNYELLGKKVPLGFWHPNH